jgi:DNA-binding MarR family transcriptional regulator
MAGGVTNLGKRGTDLDKTVEAVLLASQALVGIAARSLAMTESEVTLPQYRALVLLLGRGEQNVSTLADALGIHASTATRLCDRLLAKGLIERALSVRSRREVTVRLSSAGRSLVRSVMQRRRRDIRRIVERLEPKEWAQLVDAFERFASAGGEIPDQAWRLGWHS